MKREPVSARAGADHSRRRTPSTSAIRPATLDDVPLLVELMQEFYAESNTPFDPEPAADTFSRLLREPTRGAAWIVEHAGAPAGYAVLCIGFSLEFGGLDAFVDDLFVRPEYRRRGLGRAALTTLFDECVTRGVRVVHLEVSRDNQAAKDLYRRFGFRDTDRQLLSVPLPKHNRLAYRGCGTIRR